MASLWLSSRCETYQNVCLETKSKTRVTFDGQQPRYVTFNTSLCTQRDIFIDKKGKTEKESPKSVSLVFRRHLFEY